MIRGILTGGFWGLVTVVVGLSVASLLAPQPAGNRPPEAPLVEAPPDATPDATATTSPDDLSVTVAPKVEGQADAGQAAPIPTPVAGEGADTLAGTLVDTTSADLPLTGDIGAEPAVPSPGFQDDAATAVSAGTDQPVWSGGQAPAPQLPAPEEALALSTDPATPAPVVDDPVADVATQTDQPAAPAPEAAALPVADPLLPETAAGATPEAAADTLPEVMAVPDSPDLSDPAPAPVTATAEVPEAVTADPAVPAADATAPDPVRVDLPAADTPVVAENVLPDPPPAALAAPVVPVEPDLGTAPEPAREAVAEPELPAVIVRQADGNTLPGSEASIRINRPGTEPQEGTEDLPQVASDPATDVAVTDPVPDSSALVAYAASLDNPEGKPLLGLVLIDTGDLNDGPAVIGALPFGVSVAIDPSMPGAADLAASYRAAGVEVLALARLPQGAVPTDVEVTLESVFTTLPEVIGLLDAGEGGLQANSAVTDQVMSRLAADGRGVLTVSKGLNMAARAAEAAGVPAGTIFRDLDSEGQDATVIRRFLDQAAFSARQNGAVILLARLRPDTISALMLWGAEQRAEQVAVSPVSAVLLQDAAAEN